MSDKKYITFIDNAGRSIFGTAVTDNESILEVENPVMIMVQQQENQQMAVQLYPLFFAEFIKPDDAGKRVSRFTYSKASIATSGIEVDPRIIEQYEKVVNPVLIPAGEAPKPSEEPEVVKLFDD